MKYEGRDPKPAVTKQDINWAVLLGRVRWLGFPLPLALRSTQTAIAALFILPMLRLQWLVARAVTNRPSTRNGWALAWNVIANSISWKSGLIVVGIHDTITNETWGIVLRDVWKRQNYNAFPDSVQRNGSMNANLHIEEIFSTWYLTSYLTGSLRKYLNCISYESMD